MSLGNFLIKNVVDVLSREFPRLKVFCTLSPVPGFAAWLGALLKNGDADRSKLPALTAVAARLGTDLAKIASDPNCVDRLMPLKEPLTRLCATYLLQRADGGVPAQDPVARFHLNNGATLERINWLADPSKKACASRSVGWSTICTSLAPSRTTTRSSPEARSLRRAGCAAWR